MLWVNQCDVTYHVGITIERVFVQKDVMDSVSRKDCQTTAKKSTTKQTEQKTKCTLTLQLTGEEFVSISTQSKICSSDVLPFKIMRILVCAPKLGSQKVEVFFTPNLLVQVSQKIKHEVYSIYSFLITKC